MSVTQFALTQSGVCLSHPSNSQARDHCGCFVMGVTLGFNYGAIPLSVLSPQLLGSGSATAERPCGATPMSTNGSLAVSVSGLKHDASHGSKGSGL